MNATAAVSTVEWTSWHRAQVDATDRHGSTSSMTHASSHARTSPDAASDAMQARAPRILSNGLSPSTAELAALPASQWHRSFGPSLSRMPEAAGQAPNMRMKLTKRAFLAGGRAPRATVIQSRFAAHARCWRTKGLPAAVYSYSEPWDPAAVAALSAWVKDLRSAGVGTSVPVIVIAQHESAAVAGLPEIFQFIHMSTAL